jgi:hypothetical protein
MFAVHLDGLVCLVCLADGGLTYIDIIRYDPKLISESPYQLPVDSIPPVFQSRVRVLLRVPNRTNCILLHKST